MKLNFLKSLPAAVRVGLVNIVVFGWLVSSCDIPEGNLQRDEDTANLFQEAVNQANSATTLSKPAKTKQEWNAATAQWRKALILMQLVPVTDPNYAIAQQKLQEYQRNLDSAQKKAQAAK